NAKAADGWGRLAPWTPQSLQVPSLIAGKPLPMRDEPRKTRIPCPPRLLLIASYGVNDTTLTKTRCSMAAERDTITGRVLAGVLIGAGLAALYSALVAVVHFAVHGRWDRAPVVAVAFVAVGSVLGLVTAWAYAEPQSRRRSIPRLTMRGY